MTPLLLERGSAGALSPGLVLAQDVRGQDGKVALGKGRVLSEADVRLLHDLPWSELHLVAIEPGDVHEDEAGRRLAHAAAGEGVQVQPLAGGAWPLHARHRGILHIDPRLAEVNELADIVVYTLPHHHIVLAGELLGRAKIVPFVTAEARVRAAELVAASTHGLLRVKPFLPTRVAAVVQESLDPAQLQRFRAALEEKLAFFGSQLLSVEVVPKDPAQLAAALTRALAAGAQLALVAGSKPMDPLDPALQGLLLAGARLEMHGVPVHPGTLLWLAWLDGAPVVGMPSCGLFSKATVLDLLLPRLLAGERLSRSSLAALGSGGLLTRDALHRFPPYRPSKNRGELDG